MKLSYEYKKGGKVEKSKANSDLKAPVTIAFAAASGGMGKTSDVYLLCKYLADKGFNVIGIDGDPQANLGLAQKRVPVFRKTTVLGGYHEGCIECYPTGILIACDSP